MGLTGTGRPLILQNPDGSYAGVDGDTVARLNALLGTHIVFELGEWSELVDKLKDRRIDGLSSSVVHEERRGFASFTDVYSSFQKFIYVKNEAAAQIRSTDDLAGKRLAFQTGHLYDQKALASFPGVTPIPKPEFKQKYEAVLSGEADGFIGDFATEYRLRKGAISYFKPVLALKGDIQEVFSIRKDWPELVSILNKGLKAIPEDERLRIKQRYVSDSPTLARPGGRCAYPGRADLAGPTTHGACAGGRLASLHVQEAGPIGNVCRLPGCHRQAFRIQGAVRDDGNRLVGIHAGCRDRA